MLILRLKGQAEINCNNLDNPLLMLALASSTLLKICYKNLEFKPLSSSSMKRKTSVEFLVGSSLTCLDESFQTYDFRRKKLKISSEDLGNCIIVANSLFQILNEVI